MKEETFAAYNVSDLRELARRRLPKRLFEFVDRGTEDEIDRTLALIGCRSIDELNPAYLRHVDAHVPAVEVTL